MVKEQIKSLLHTLAPKQFDALMAGRINRHGQNFMAKHGVPAIASDFVERYGLSGCRYTGRITRCPEAGSNADHPGAFSSLS